MRLCDFHLAFPGILLAIAVIAVLGPEIINVIYAVAVFSIPIFARLARGTTLQLTKAVYVDASRRASGLPACSRSIYPRSWRMKAISAEMDFSML